MRIPRVPDRIEPPVSDPDRTNEFPSVEEKTSVDLVDLSVDVELDDPGVLEFAKAAPTLDLSMDEKNKDVTEVFGAVAPRKQMATLMGVGIARPQVGKPAPASEGRGSTLAGLPLMLPPPANVDPSDLRVPTFRPRQAAFGPLPPPVPPPRFPSRNPSLHPSSMSPLALDIGAEAEAARVEPTTEVAPGAKIPRRARPELAIVAGVAAWTVMAASVFLVLAGTYIGVKQHSAAKANAAHAQVAATPPPVVEVARPPVFAPQEKIVQPVPVVKGPAGAQTGVLRVPTSMKNIFVDGAPRKVEGGALFLSCGKHLIKAPGRPPRTVEIPCGKTVLF